MGPIFRTELLIYYSKVNLDEKRLFGDFTYQRPRNYKDAGKELVSERGFHVPFWSVIYF